MKIEQIKIKNFKLFRDEEFSFNPHMNIIIGNNATGKTTLLEALSYSLGTIFMGLKREESIPLRYEDKRREIISPDNIEIQLPFRIDIKQSLDNKSYEWHRGTDRERGGATNYKYAKEIIDKAKELASKVREGESVNLPLIAYYGTERVNDKSQKRVTYQKQGSRLDGYYGALDSRTLKGQFLEWFKSYEDSVLKFGKDKTLYNAFTNAITNMVEDWEKIHFSWAMDDIMGQLKDGNWVSFSMMSAGYQSIIRLTADIAYRAIKLNPHLGKNAVIKTQGVVLIDEIDMHLHPKWQKRVISDLKSTFPNIQFIATTHSPFIIQSLRANELIILDGESATGGFCSYCERQGFSSALDVEHINDKKSHSSQKYLWSNFLLACKNCNSIKGTKLIDDCLMPHTDNTFRIFSYLESGFIIINPTLTNPLKKKSKNLVDLVGLDRVPSHKKYSNKDNRWQERKKVWTLSQRYLFKYRNDHCDIDTIIDLALSNGFWSIWMTLFEEYREVQEALIETFAGTNKDYNY